MSSGEKRDRDTSGEQLRGYRYAVDVLQKALPVLRPQRNDSMPLEKSLDLLVQHWREESGDAQKKARGQYGGGRKKSWGSRKTEARLASDATLAWNLVRDAEEDEKSSLRDFVKKLDSKEGRAELIAMRRGRVEERVRPHVPPLPTRAT